MTPGPSFTMPTTADPAPASSSVDPTNGDLTPDQRQLSSVRPSTSADRLIPANPNATNNGADGEAHQGAGEMPRRSEPGLAQPKHCARCGQLLDALPSSHDRQASLPRSSSSASLSAPSPSSYAFAPDSIRSQHRLQPNQSLTSAINAAAAVALSRHLGADESVSTNAEGHAICTQCAAQLADGSNEVSNTVPNASNTAVLGSSHTNDTVQQPLLDNTRANSLEAQNGHANSYPQSTALSAAHPNFPPNASTESHSAVPQPSGPQAQLTISVDNMGTGGDAVLTQSAEDVHMRDSSVLPPLERVPVSPAPRAPSSPSGSRRSTSRSRIRFADDTSANGEFLGQQRTADAHSLGGAAQESGSSSYPLTRSGSFSRSLSYNGSGPGPESVSSSSAPVVVSFPPSSLSVPVPETATLSNAQSTHIDAFPSSSSTQPPTAQAISRSSSHLHASASTQEPAARNYGQPPAHTLPSGAKQRRASSTRRLSRSGSSTGPTTLPFAAVGASAGLTKDDDPYGPGAVTRPRLSLLPTHVIADELYNSARQTRPASLISHSTSTSLAASSAQHAAGIEPSRAVKYHSDPASFALSEDAKQQDGTVAMDVDDETVTSGIAAKWGDVRWFDPYKPDPLAELSHLRTPPKGRGCLYPGATFNGTQKSGRNSYDVTVRIVNVDLEASHLCGYLNIRGLTEDWPELTTYFDAEIIGDRYGFDTGKWGATEADDLKHWARFPPFRPLRSALSKPGLRFNHLNKPFVFMRWKEKFLVPDHRVRDINGASFAGFYYVCVELGESAGRPPSSSTAAAMDDEARRRSNSNVSMSSATTGGGGHGMSPAASPTLSNTSASLTGPAVSGQQWYAARTQRRRELSLSAPTYPLSSTSSNGGNLAHAFHQQQQQQQTQSNITYYHPIYHPHSPHGLPPSGPGFWPASPTSPHMPLSAGGGEADPFANMWPEMAANQEGYDDMGAMGKMSGFYFHENSEPYQQLSLHHTPECSSSSFEMR